MGKVGRTTDHTAQTIGTGKRGKRGGGREDGLGDVNKGGVRGRDGCIASWTPEAQAATTAERSRRGQEKTKFGPSSV